MSRSFTSRPTYTNTRGRGSSRGRGVTKSTNKMDHGQSPSNTRGRGLGAANRHIETEDRLNDATESASAGEQDRMQRRDAYTMITPNEKKRQKITEGARKEEEAYQRHREQNRLGAVSYMGTVGGGEVSQPAARQRTVNQNKQAAFNVKSKSSQQYRNYFHGSMIYFVPFYHRSKSQQYRDTERKKENEQLDKMKTEQRRKSELNKHKEEERQHKLKSEHRAKNEAFLARFEQGVQQQKSKKILSSTVTANQTESSYDESPIHCYDNDDDITASVGSVSLTTDNSQSSHPMDLLIKEFPEADPDVLETLLLQCNGNLDRVRGMLS